MEKGPHENEQFASVLWVRTGRSFMARYGMGNPTPYALDISSNHIFLVIYFVAFQAEEEWKCQEL